MPKLEEGVDYYIENGLFVLTKSYLENRGYCCKNGCRHCPYGFRQKAEKHKNTGGNSEAPEITSK
jgi:hypothetical protein